MSDSMYEKLKDDVYFSYFEVKKKHDMKGLSREECMQIFAKMNEERKPFMHRYENPFMNIPSYADKFFGMFFPSDSNSLFFLRSASGCLAYLSLF